MCILAASIGLTVITCNGKSWISASDADQRAIALEHIGPPLVYHNNGRAIASLVFAWLGFVSTVGAYVLLSRLYGEFTNELLGLLLCSCSTDTTVSTVLDLQSADQRRSARRTRAAQIAPTPRKPWAVKLEEK